MTVDAAPCPICGSRGVRSFLEVPETPVLCNVLWPTRAEAMAAPRGDIRLGFCPDCGYIYNQAFDPKLLHYTAGYENSLHFSARFQAYADELADGLIERFDLRGRDIVEVGCGQADFLRLLCVKGPNRGVGFDPSHRAGPEPDGGGDTFSVVTDIYDERYAHVPVDFLCSRHVLEHIQHPVAFLEGIRRTIGDRRSAGLFFEVPDVAFTLRDLAIWDLIYEHCSYFSHPSIARLFADRGFDVRRTYGTFGGQFLCIDATTGDARGGKGPDGGAREDGGGVRTGVGARTGGGVRTGDEGRTGGQGGEGGDGGDGRTRDEALDDRGAPELASRAPGVTRGRDAVRGFAVEIAELGEAVEAFPAGYRTKVDAWRRTFGRIRGEGRRAVVWGAGSKGVSILNVLRDDHPVDFIVDLNPRKHGMYVSGTGQEIVSPEFLRDYRPDVVVGMNAIYADEIRGMLGSLGVEAELVFA